MLVHWDPLFRLGSKQTDSKQHRNKAMWVKPTADRGYPIGLVTSQPHSTIWEIGGGGGGGGYSWNPVGHIQTGL